MTEKDVITDEGRFQLKDKAETPQERISSLEKEVERLKGEFKRSKIAVPDPKQAGREVTKLMDAYIGKRLPVVHQSIMEDMKKLFAEMRKPDGNWNLVDDLCRNVAEKVVSNMEILHDEYWQQYTDLRKSLKNTTLKLDETYWNDVVDFEDLRKAHFGTLSLSRNKGVSIDTYYQELAETYPELFDASEYTNEVDQLYNIIDTVEGMRPYTEDYSEGEIAEFADTIAKDVLQLGYDLSQKETFADRAYNEKMEAIEKVKAERNALMKEQRKRANERLEKKDQFYKDKIREIKEKNKDRKDRKYYTSRIEAYSQWLSDSLLRPTETKHIPESYRRAVAEMLDSFDFGTKRKDKYAEKNGPSKKTIKLAALNKAYKEIMAQESSMLEADDEISTLIDDLSVALEGKRFEDLETEQLVGVYRLVKNIRFAISSVNKTFSEGLRENISDYAERIIRETAGKKNKTELALTKSISQGLNASNVTPYDAFTLMGDTMGELYQNMRKGLDKHIDNVTQAKDFVTELTKKYKVKNWIDKKTKAERFSLESGETIELVPAQIMSLYCLMKREQAVKHILEGGIAAAPLSVKRKDGKWSGKILKKTLDQSRVKATLADIENIISTLTEEQRTVAEELQGFMSTTCADWGNETSMKLFGYKKFGEKNYFPIKSKKTFVRQNLNNDDLVPKLKNAGPTKATSDYANNPIVIDDIFSVFAEHTNFMSMYNAQVPSMTDFERVFNYKNKEGVAVHEELARVFGTKMTAYISKFMSDLNQNYAKNTDHQIAEKAVANAKKSSIGASLRVLLQQPTAKTRAATVMSPRYLMNPNTWKGLVPGKAKKVREEMFEHCPIARWKSWGFYNINVSRDMREIFLDKKGIADEVFMGIYGKADDMTWSMIWIAVKNEISHERKDLEVGSDAYWNAVNERFSYVVDRTQVVDSVFHRSQAMRNKELYAKMVTSFMAEPTKTYNLCRTEYILAARDFKNGEYKKCAARITRVTSVYLATALNTAMAAAVADAIRGLGDDDKEKDLLQRWIDYTQENFVEMANPLSLLPGYRDIVSLLEGFDVNRMDIDGIKKLLDSIDYWESETATDYFAFKKTAAAISTLTGIPIGNVMREYESVRKTYKHVFEGQMEAAFFSDKLRFDIKSDRNRSKFAYDYALAQDRGDTKTANKIQQEVIAAGADLKKWEASVRSQQKNVAANKAADIVNDKSEAEAKKVVRSYCAKYDWKFEEIWAKTLEAAEKRKSTFQKAYDDTLGKLIRGEA